MKHACEEISRLASEKLERNLSLMECIRLRLHLLMCSACKHYDASMTRLHQALQLRQKYIVEGLGMPQDKREKIRALLQHLSQQQK